jgi:hypothetical protein
MASLDPQLRKMLIVALRWLMCSSGQVTIDLIADELEGKWELQAQKEDGLEEYLDEEEEEDYADFESDSESSLGVRESTPFAEHWAQHRDITKDLRIAGRDFLVIEGTSLETQHNSIRDFIAEEEEAIKHEVERCSECRKRLQETIAYEAGPKEGNGMFLSSVNRPIPCFCSAKEFLIADFCSHYLPHDTSKAE